MLSSIPANTDNFFIQVPVIDDNLYEKFDKESIRLRVTDTCNGSVNPNLELEPATGFIFDNEDILTVSIEFATAVEGQDLVFTVNISPKVGTRVADAEEDGDQTATRYKDYRAPHPADFSIVLPEESSTAEVRLGTIDDGDPRAAIATILDND